MASGICKEQASWRCGSLCRGLGVQYSHTKAYWMLLIAFDFPLTSSSAADISLVTKYTNREPFISDSKNQSVLTVILSVIAMSAGNVLWYPRHSGLLTILTVRHTAACLAEDLGFRTGHMHPHESLMLEDASLRC